MHKATTGTLITALLLLAAGAGAQQATPGPVRFSGLFYVAYQQGEAGGNDYAAFRLNRAYLTGQTAVLPHLSARITMDAHQDGEGDMEVRLKYLYAKYDFGDVGVVRGLGLEGGLVHMVWLDFEEHVDLYRMRDPMFVERTGLFNSADFGVTLAGDLGPSLGEDYTSTVNSHYAGRHGSFAIGVYNGGGYHAAEANTGKVVEGRLTLRPLPDRLPGLQVSGLAIFGQGNVPDGGAGAPDWRTYDVFLSYQHAMGTVTAQYVWGAGNQGGSWTEPLAPGDATDYNGYSVFGEGRIGNGFRLVGGFDHFERTPGPGNQSFQRLHGGVGYDLGHENILLLDVDSRNWDQAGRPTDTRFQVVMQAKF